MSYRDLSDDDVAIITEALQEKMSRLDSELPDPSVATDDDWKKAGLAIRLNGLIGKLNPKHCGLHDRAEPCPRCAVYCGTTKSETTKPETTKPYCSCNNWEGSDYYCALHGTKTRAE